jgi:arsenate reductase
MAEALLHAYGGADFEAHSAGTEPKGLNPLTIKVMAEAGIDVSHQRSKSLDRFLNHSFDYVITVCDRARDNCPTFPGDNERIHWGFRR